MALLTEQHIVSVHADLQQITACACMHQPTPVCKIFCFAALQLHPLLPACQVETAYTGTSEVLTGDVLWQLCLE